MTTAFSSPWLLCPHCCQRPAAVVVPFQAPISPWDTQPERVLSCTTPVCVGLAEAEAEANGVRGETEPLTLEVAEDITGDKLGEAAA